MWTEEPPLPHCRRVKVVEWGEGEEGNGGCLRPSTAGKESKGEGLFGTMTRDVAISFTAVSKDPVLELLLGSLPKEVRSLAISFLFSRFRESAVVGGGKVNPLFTVSSAAQEDPWGFFPAVVDRIPAQVIGHVLGVKTIKRIFPSYNGGHRLKVNICLGGFVEGIIAFIFILIDLMLTESSMDDCSKTFIYLTAGATLDKLGAPFTGGVMNPASAFAWAYTKGTHMTMEHLFVYWIMPFVGTFLAMLTFNLVVRSKKNAEAMDKDIRWKFD